MKVICKILGVLMILGGIVFGIYVGLWWAFIGGLFDIIREVRAPYMQASNILIGVLKMVGAGAIGGIATICVMFPGAALMSYGDDR